MAADRTRPALACPECGEEGVIPAHGRGRNDRDGNEVWHRDTCRCRWCTWWWSDDADPVVCQCGAAIGVVVDDDHAYASTRPS